MVWISLSRDTATGGGCDSRRLSNLMASAWSNATGCRKGSRAVAMRGSFALSRGSLPLGSLADEDVRGPRTGTSALHPLLSRLFSGSGAPIAPASTLRSASASARSKSTAIGKSDRNLCWNSRIQETRAPCCGDGGGRMSGISRLGVSPLVVVAAAATAAGACSRKKRPHGACPQ